MTDGATASADSSRRACLGKRERTRLALLQAAIRVLAEQGLEGTSIDEFTRAAGMARGTFYNYFDSREALAFAVSQHIREAMYAAVIDPLPANFTPAQVISCTTCGFLRYGLRHPETGWALIRIGGSAPWVRGERFARTHEAMQGVLPAGVPLRVGLVYIEGVVLMVLRRLLEGVIDLAQAETALTLALHGLGIPAEDTAGLMAQAREFVASVGL